MNKVHFSYAEGIKLIYPNKTHLKNHVKELFKMEEKQLETLNYIFCSDEFLLQINKQHLQHDFYTDIITFDLSETKETTIGEIYISLDRVKENAKQLQLPFKIELERVVFHGALHLCGYKDKKKEDVLLMRKKEDYYLKLCK